MSRPRDTEAPALLSAPPTIGPPPRPPEPVTINDDGSWFGLARARRAAHGYAHRLAHRHRDGSAVTRCGLHGRPIALPTGAAVHPCPRCTPDAHRHDWNDT